MLIVMPLMLMSRRVVFEFRNKLGNTEADTAADVGRRHQTELLIDARRSLLQARTFWYPVILQLHRFMIAVSRVAVYHDGKRGFCP